MDGGAFKGYQFAPLIYKDRGRKHKGTVLWSGNGRIEKNDKPNVCVSCSGVTAADHTLCSSARCPPRAGYFCLFPLPVPKPAVNEGVFHASKINTSTQLIT